MPTYDESREAAGVLFQQKKYAECEHLCDHMLGVTLKDPWILAMLGSLHSMNGRFGHAIMFFQRAVNEDKTFSEAWNGLGIALRSVGQEEAARQCYEKAIEIEPKGEYWGNYAGTYINSGEPEKCIEYSKKALELKPDFPMAHSNMALALLEMKRWDEGFTEYMYRKTTDFWSQRDYKCPPWDGKPTELLVVHGEQGLGDEIMFLTCIEDLLKVQKNIVIEVSPRLTGLLTTTFPGIPIHPKPEDILEKYKPTAYMAMGDLGYWFRRNGQFPRKPYLKSSYSCSTGSRPRIGISWYGGSRKTHSYARNFAIKFWQPIIDCDAEVISLQYGPHGASEAAQMGITHNQEWIDDLDKLAAQIKSCDLVVSVCNTTVHMAGALGVPCFVFVPDRAAWRYGVEGEEMAWYESVRLFRQKKDQPWNEVVEVVAGEIDRLLKAGYEGSNDVQS